MADTLGIIALLVCALVTLILAVRHPSIGVVLFVALSVRAAAALFHFYVAPLPDGTSDAVSFEQNAWEWSQGGFSAALGHFEGPDSYFYSWLMSLLYAITDRSLLMLQATSVLAGVFCVFFAWQLARELWDSSSARKVAWLMALFPMVVQYGALTMREVWIVLFFILGLIGVVRWAKIGGLGPAVGGIAAFVVATFFHGGMFVAILAFLSLICAREGKRMLNGLYRGRIAIFAFIGLIAIVSAIAGYVGSGISLPKLGTALDAVDLQSWIARSQYQQSLEDAGARYGDWLVASQPIDFLWIVPIKSFYLIFAPFPWDLRAPQHIIGLVDALLYLSLTFYALRYRKSIWANPGSRAVLLIFLAMVLAFGVGTGNFGTGMRHRAKFVVALFVLAAPKIPQLILLRSKNSASSATSAIGKK
ncbi:ArnT family glycosyltransferase [Halomonas sp.]|uniref:ArnT family glycosyltransferase n=1 Tax=Halomonas sp. TaxID=1486246 RepID=UPI00384CBA1D